MPDDQPSAIRRVAGKPVSAGANIARGFRYSLMGFQFALSKGFKRWTLAPVLISIAIFSAFAASFGYAFWDLVTKWFGNIDHWYEWAGAITIGLVVVVAFALICFFTFVLLVSVLAAPFTDILSEKTEAKITGRKPDERFTLKRFVMDILRGISHALKLVMLQVAVLILGLVPFVGPPVAIVGTALLLSIEYMDPAMVRRRMRFSEKRRMATGNATKCLGFGLGAMLWLVIPGVNLVAIPAAVCGATALLLDLEGRATGGGERVPNDTAG